jgi:hypothetical protein
LVYAEPKRGYVVAALRAWRPSIASGQPAY